MKSWEESSPHKIQSPAYKNNKKIFVCHSENKKSSNKSYDLNGKIM